MLSEWCCQVGTRTVITVVQRWNVMVWGRQHSHACVLRPIHPVGSVGGANRGNRSKKRRGANRRRKPSTSGVAQFAGMFGSKPRAYTGGLPEPTYNKWQANWGIVIQRQLRGVSNMCTLVTLLAAAKPAARGGKGW